MEKEIKPHYVGFNTAKLLKEKGFNLECRAFYLEDKLQTPKATIGNYNDIKWVSTWRNSPFDDTTSAPEQWVVVEWASLVHNIDIEARPVRYAGDVKTSYYQPYINGCIVNMSKFTTKQEALSEAISEFLKMI